MATHLPQALAMVTLMTVGSAVLGQTGWPLLSVFIAASAGQSAVGWTNDYLDAQDDLRLKRESKPVVRDGFDVSRLRRPITVALVLVIPFSLAAAGLVGGLAHIFAVVQGLIYDKFAARRTWSWVPYALAFGALPAFVMQSVNRNLWPSWQVLLTCSLVGVIAHLLNALPDIEIDRRVGHGGLAVRLGSKAAKILTAALAVAAGYLLILQWLTFA